MRTSAPAAIDARVRLPEEFAPVDDSAERQLISAGYEEVFGREVNDGDTSDLVAQMAAGGVGAVIVHAEHETGEVADALNEALAGFVAADPAARVGVGTASLSDETAAGVRAKQVRQCAEFGFVGVNVQPAFFGLTILSPQLYEVYAAASEAEISVAVHTGINYSSRHPMSGDQPILIDQVACDFPDLRIIAMHSGWPWIPEMVAVARKHPNVYFDFGGMAPKYIAATGSGWEMMLRFSDNLLSDQALFASDWPVMAIDDAMEQFRQLPLKPANIDKMTCSNVLEAYPRAASHLAKYGRT